MLARRCSQLEVLLLKSAWLSDETATVLAHHCPALRELVAELSGAITDAGIIELAGGCPLIERGEISAYDGYGSQAIVTDVGLTALAKGCP